MRIRVELTASEIRQALMYLDDGGVMDIDDMPSELACKLVVWAARRRVFRPYRWLRIWQAELAERLWDAHHAACLMRTRLETADSIALYAKVA